MKIQIVYLLVAGVLATPAVADANSPMVDVY